MSVKKQRKGTEASTIDVDTFKAWLQGVEDMQSDDWTPSQEQWKKIRQKIDQLTAAIEEETPFVPQGQLYRGAPVDAVASTYLPPEPQWNAPVPRPAIAPINMAPTDLGKPVEGQVDGQGNYASKFG